MNRVGATPFLLPAKAVDVEMMQFLVDLEADRAVKLCLDLGENPAAIDANGETARHGAVLRGANGAVRLLVDAGAQLDARNKKGWTPLRIAEGVSHNGTTKQMLHAAALLRELTTDRGVPIDENLGSGAVGYASPRKKRQRVRPAILRFGKSDRCLTEHVLPA